MFTKSSVFMMLLAASLVVISSTQSQLKVVVGQGQGPFPAQPLQKNSQILAQQPQQQQQQPPATTTTLPTAQSSNQGQMVRQEPGLPGKITQLSEQDMLLAHRDISLSYTKNGC